MRPGYLFFTFLLLVLMADIFIYLDAGKRSLQHKSDSEVMQILVGALGLTDLAVSTEARYTRHPAVSDTMAPFMDHPGAIEHFPTGSFWVPVQ